MREGLFVRELPAGKAKGVSVLRILIERREADMEAEQVSEQYAVYPTSGGWSRYPPKMGPIPPELIHVFGHVSVCRTYPTSYPQVVAYYVIHT